MVRLQSNLEWIGQECLSQCNGQSSTNDVGQRDGREDGTLTASLRSTIGQAFRNCEESTLSGQVTLKHTPIDEE